MGTRHGQGSRAPEAVPLEDWDGVPLDTLARRWDVPAVEAYATLGSTNDRAAELAAAGARPFTVVLADEQTAGRGRRGARWWSESGRGLLMSIVAPRAGDEGGVGCLPLQVGLAVAEAVERRCPGVSVAVKWPNDLLVRDRKLGGILCEARAGAVVIGIGLNVLGRVAGVDPHVGDTATSLEDEGVDSVARRDMAGVILGRVEAAIASGRGSLTPDQVRALAARDALLGRSLRTEGHGVGVGRGVEPDGALVLERLDGSRVRVRAGSISISPPRAPDGG